MGTPFQIHTAMLFALVVAALVAGAFADAHEEHQQVAHLNANLALLREQLAQLNVDVESAASEQEAFENTLAQGAVDLTTAIDRLVVSGTETVRAQAAANSAALSAAQRTQAHLAENVLTHDERLQTLEQA